MTKWEYDYMPLSTPKGRPLEWNAICRKLNERGLEGWELVVVVSRLMLTRAALREGQLDRTREFPVAILKRPYID
jgi:hypothetical protein